MPDLRLHMLGELEVIRDGVALPLPPSRKTRCLLAYLALQERPLRREMLCELLWEIPDDPRGSLRWSLSKLRKLVDSEQRLRILADRNTVAFATADVAIDVLEQRRAAASPQEVSDEELARLVESGGGEFLAGLDLPDFHDYHAWFIGERERALRDRAVLLREWLRRVEHVPERALQPAVALVALLPHDEDARARLIRLLVQLGRQDEAQRQYRLGVEKLAEVGAADSGSLRAALQPPASAAPPQPASAARPALAPVQAPEYSLVGREAEMARLREWMDRPSGARVVLLRGEPGIGKSRLLQAVALLARERDAGLLKASAFESERMRPFGVWNDALRRALPDNATSQMLAGGEQVSRQQVFDSLVEVLRTETGRHPVVVLCDDAHWVDEASASALHYVVRTNRRQPLLVVASSREVELRENTALQQVMRGLRAEDLLDELPLQPLSAAEIQRLVGQQFPAADAAALAAEVGGNPLLALELARAGVEGGSSLAELVVERMAFLDDTAQAVLAWSAVLAPRVSARNLAHAGNLDEAGVVDALERAEQLGLLLPGERGLRFSHELIRRAVYERIAPSRRHAMHRRVAELLEVEAALDLDLAADLAHHARLSGDPLMAGKAMVSAGRLCLRFYANEEAMALYREGLAFADQLTEAQRVCLVLELGEIRMNAQPEEVSRTLVEEFVDLAEQAMDHGSRAHARLGYQMASYLRWMHGEIGPARRFSLQAERVSRGASEESQVLGLAEAAKCLALLERDLSQADAMVMEARALAQRHACDYAAVPLTLGILRYYEERYEEALDCLEEARGLAKAEGDRFSEYMINEYLAMVEIERGDCRAAERHARAMAAIGERLREGSERPFADALLALCRFAQGSGEAGLEEALAALRLADAKQRLAYVLNRAAMCYLKEGRPAVARECAREALEQAQVMERPSEALLALLNLERVHRADPALEPASRMAQIEQLVRGGVAGWARRRCDELLETTTP